MIKNNKKLHVVFAGAVVFGITMFYGTAHAALPAPYDLQAQWGVNGSGLHNLNAQFNYDASFISQVKAFRFYQKRPGASAFSEVTAFNNPSSIYRDCSAQALTQESLNKSMTVGSWQLYHLCTETSQDYWTLNKTTLLEPASAFPAGQYDFYIAVLDASGIEAAVSPVASQYVLEQSKILSPAPGDSPGDVTTIRWTVPSGWPSDLAHYVIEIFDGTPVGQGPLNTISLYVEHANTIGEFSQSYTGPKLDPAKMYTILIQEGSYVIQKESPNPKNPTGSPYQSYISMSMPVKIEAPPRALNIRVGQVTDTNAYIYWDSNVPAVSSVNYKTALSNTGGAVTADTSTFQTSYGARLKNLAPNTKYYFSIRLKNALQNEVETEFSENNSFTTLAPPPPPPPPAPKPIPLPPPAPKSVSKPAPAPVVKPVPTPLPKLEPKEEKQIEKPSPSTEEKAKQSESVAPEEQKPRGIFRRFIDGLKSIWHGLFSSSAGTASSEKSTESQNPRIDSISPTVGTPNLVTITGSGFTIKQDYETRIGNVNLPAGNYIRIPGEGTMGAPSFSPDGKTLKFQLALSEADVKNCPAGTTTNKKCQISLQVVNGKGIPSNVVHFQVYMPNRPLVLFMSLDSQNPTAQNLAAGAKDAEVLRFKLRAAADNPVNFDVTDFVVKALPTDLTKWGDQWGIYCNEVLGGIKITDASTGELVGSNPWSSSIMGSDQWSAYLIGSTPWGSSYHNDNLSYCRSAVPTWISLSPGQEKSFSVKLSLVPQAKAGLQFRITAEKTFNDIDTVRGGGDYTPMTSNLITIIAP